MRVKEIPFRKPTVGALLKLQQDGLKGIVDTGKRSFALYRVEMVGVPHRGIEKVKLKLHNVTGYN
jgi:hypothetical protein